MVNLQRFRSQQNEVLDHNEEYIRMLREYESTIGVTLNELEDRLSNLETKISPHSADNS